MKMQRSYLLRIKDSHRVFVHGFCMFSCCKYATYNNSSNRDNHTVLSCFFKKIPFILPISERTPSPDRIR